ncbi:MAG: hypothetical protein B7Z76_14285 [Acidiphilium sp. 20-67-58]|nr:MAG: hypothetical protein B7Z76_14285 [Acidiphilium sp. 20-67-58]
MEKTPLRIFRDQGLGLCKPVKRAGGFGPHIECKHDPYELECRLLFIECRGPGHSDALQAESLTETYQIVTWKVETVGRSCSRSKGRD